MKSLCNLNLCRQFIQWGKPNIQKNFLESNSGSVLPSRNTFILKRKYQPKLIKIGYTDRQLKAKDFLYELVEDTNCKPKPDVTVVLKEFVEGLGRKGDCVTLKRSKAYNDLLLTGLADYATPEMIEEAKSRDRSKGEDMYSSTHVPRTIKFLENMCLSVVMNKDVDWTLEPWHVKVAFRKASVTVPLEAIELPPKPIKGPNLDLEGKAFLVTVTINKREKVTVRCRLHHWSPNPSEQLPFAPEFWAQPYSCIFPEDEDRISKLPVIKYKTTENASQSQ